MSVCENISMILKLFKNVYCMTTSLENTNQKIYKYNVKIKLK